MQFKVIKSGKSTVHYIKVNEQVDKDFLFVGKMISESINIYGPDVIPYLKEKDIKKFISNRSKLSPLSKVPYHNIVKVPYIMRFVPKIKMGMNHAELFSIHVIKNLPKKVPKYCALHKHTFDEVNMLISPKSNLVYLLKVNGLTYKINAAPLAIVHIPKGMSHSANAVSGEGYFIFRGKSSRYKALFGDKNKNTKNRRKRTLLKTTS